MSRYIDADELKSINSIQSANFNSIETIQEWIENAPTADVQKEVDYWHKKTSEYEQVIIRLANILANDVKPVSSGNWINTTHGLKCSACDTFQAYGSRYFNYCPICGARMEAGK